MTPLVICPLCGRPIPDASVGDAHHLVPRAYKGRETVLLHVMRHRKIHAVLSEKELAREYNTIERLRAHPAIAHFVDWVRDKDPWLKLRHKRGKADKRRRRRL